MGSSPMNSLPSAELMLIQREWRMPPFVETTAEEAKPLQRSDLDDFVDCFKAGRRHERENTWSEEDPNSGPVAVVQL